MHFCLTQEEFSTQLKKNFGKCDVQFKNAEKSIAWKSWSSVLESTGQCFWSKWKWKHSATVNTNIQKPRLIQNAY